MASLATQPGTSSKRALPDLADSIYLLLAHLTLLEIDFGISARNDTAGSSVFCHLI